MACATHVLTWFCKNLAFHLAQRGLHSRHLRDDVDAIAVFAHHARDAAHLPLNSAEPLQALVFYVLLHGALIPPTGIGGNIAETPLLQEPFAI